MSKAIFLILLSFCFTISVYGQQFDLQTSEGLDLNILDASKWRRILTLIDFKGSVQYQDFLFRRSGKYLDKITIQKGQKKIEISECVLLYLINYLEKQEKQAPNHIPAALPNYEPSENVLTSYLRSK